MLHTTMKLLLVLLMFSLASVSRDLTAAPKKNRNRSQAAAKQKAVTRAIAGAKTDASSAQRAAAATASQAARRQGEAIESTGRWERVKSQLAEEQQAAAGALSEIHELRYRIEQQQAPDSPYRKALAAHAAALDALDEAEQKVRKSLDYQANLARAEQSLDPTTEIERVNEQAFDESEDYQAAKRNVEQARRDLEREKLAMYNADPQYAALVQSSRQAKAAANKTESSLSAAAMEKGIESINARQATARAAAAQSVAAAAQAKVKQLEASKSKSQAKSKSGSSSGQKKK